MQQAFISARQAGVYNASQVRLLISLIEAEALLRWMHDSHPIVRSDVPEPLAAPLKHLENLGLVSRRNANGLVLQEQRLQRVLHGLVGHVPGELRLKCQQCFSWLTLEFSMTEATQADGGDKNANADKSKVEDRHGLDSAESNPAG